MYSFIKSLFYPTNYYYLSIIYEEGTWGIHGLWPQYSENQYPQYCKKVEFDITKLQSILTELNENWCSDKGSNSDFWQHEWEKHGSCMFNECDEFDYFNKALELFKFVITNNLVDKYRKGPTSSMIPFDQSFRLMEPI